MAAGGGVRYDPLCTETTSPPSGPAPKHPIEEKFTANGFGLETNTRQQYNLALSKVYLTILVFVCIPALVADLAES